MVRVVLDTNVIVAGLRSRRGASFELLSRAAQTRLRPLLTIGLFLEYEAVLNRPEQVEHHGFDKSQIGRFLTEFAAMSEPVDVYFLWRPQLDDPSDELVLEAAINGRCDFLITYNVRDFARAAVRFGVQIKTPSEFLRESQV
jgi:putative PIN family toxin of toxin-antitoxin system